MIDVIRYGPAERARWNRYLETSKNGHFMFHRDYMEYHGDRFEDASVMFENRGRLVGLLPAHRVEDGEGCCSLVSHGGLSFGGIVCGRNMRAALMVDVMEGLVAHLREAGIGRLIYKAIPHPYHRYPAEEDLFALISLGAKRIETKLSCACRVGASPRPGNKRMRGIRQAGESGLELTREVELDEFHEMHAAWLEKRHGAKPVHRLEELRLLVSRFPSQMCLYGARLGSRLIAADLVYKSPTCIRFQGTGTTDEGFEVHASDFITAHIMEHEAAPGQWLDFGTSMDPETGALDIPLIAHKESFGARSIVQDTYQLDV